MKRLLYSAIILMIFSAACKSTTKEKVVDEKVAAMNYTLTPFTQSPEFPDAKISSVAYKNGLFSFGIDSDTYELGVQTSDAPGKMCANSAQGQHIHLILDNAPYAAKYTAAFEYEVSDGDHYMLAFLSRSYHESIKTDDAHVAYIGSFENKSLKGVKKITDPMLFYSRPKGTYVGKENTNKVMLDFYLANTALGSNKVIANINGEDHTIDKWQPYYIEGLPLGENTITLTLVDGNGNKIDAPLNPVSRTFKLEADPTEG